MRKNYLALACVALIPFAAALADSPNKASTRPAPYVLAMPSGMKQVAVGDHVIICPPEDEAAVRAALAKMTPTTRPTTTASTIAQKLAANRAQLIQEMSADLSIPADKAAEFLDGDFKKSLDFLADLRPRVFIVAASERQITAAIKSGWRAPLFHYNPLADHTFFDSRITLPDSPGTKPDDLVIWSEVTAGESDAKIGDGLVKTIHDFESSLNDGVAQAALLEVRTSVAKFINDEVVKPLKMPATETWFGRGLIGAMSSKYMAPVTGYPRSLLSKSAASDTPANPIKGAPLDLLHEFDETSLKPDFAPYYLDAVGRKGAGVFQDLLDKAGDGVVPKLIAAIKATPPPDGEALATLIKTVSGVDLTNELLPPPMPTMNGPLTP